MPEPSEAAFHRADEKCEFTLGKNYRRAFALHLDEVDRVAREIKRWRAQQGPDNLEEIIAPLMLPDPPDPLAEILELTQVYYSSEENAKALRAELAKRGLEVREISDG